MLHFMISLVVTEMQTKDFTFFQLIILIACPATDSLINRFTVEKNAWDCTTFTP